MVGLAIAGELEGDSSLEAIAQSRKNSTAKLAFALPWCPIIPRELKATSYNHCCHLIDVSFADKICIIRAKDHLLFTSSPDTTMLQNVVQYLIQVRPQCNDTTAYKFTNWQGIFF